MGHSTPIKPNKVKLETQENKDNIFYGLLTRAILNMIVLKQDNNTPVRCGVGFELNDLIYYSQYYTAKNNKLMITNMTKNNPILAHTPTWPNGIRY